MRELAVLDILQRAANEYLRAMSHQSDELLQGERRSDTLSDATVVTEKS